MTLELELESLVLPEAEQVSQHRSALPGEYLLRNLIRYQGANNRELYRAMAQLERLQSAR